MRPYPPVHLEKWGTNHFDGGQDCSTEPAPGDDALGEQTRTSTRTYRRLSWRDEMSYPLLTLIDVVHCNICDLSQSDNVRPRT